MTEQNKSHEDVITNHITGLERQITSLNLTLDATRTEMNQRAVEASNHSADVRVKAVLITKLQDTLTEERAENAAMRKNFMDTGLLIQEQHNKTRTELEKATRELNAERNRPVGSTDFILHLLVVSAAQALYSHLLTRSTHVAFTQKRLSRLQADVLNESTLTPEVVDAPLGLQEIVKGYCATARTNFDSDTLLPDVSNYVEENSSAILALDAVRELNSLREQISSDRVSERKMCEAVDRMYTPDAIRDYFNQTRGEYLMNREQHQHAILESVKEIAISFIESISFEIPIDI